jgi:hypothetical protein
MLQNRLQEIYGDISPPQKFSSERIALLLTIISLTDQPEHARYIAGKHRRILTIISSRNASNPVSKFSPTAPF